MSGCLHFSAPLGESSPGWCWQPSGSGLDSIVFLWEWHMGSGGQWPGAEWHCCHHYSCGWNCWAWGSKRCWFVQIACVLVCFFCHKWPIVFLVNRQVQRFIADSISWLQAKDGEKDGELTWWAVPTTCFFFPGRTLRLRLPWKRQFLLRERRLNLFCCVTHGVWWSIVRSRMTLLAPLPLQLWLKFLGVRQQMMLICPDCLCSGLVFCHKWSILFCQSSSAEIYRR